jgi:hypothetical protein
VFGVNFIYGRLGGEEGMQMFPESHSLPVATGGLISKCVVAGTDFSMWGIVSLSNILFVSVILQTKED